MGVLFVAIYLIASGVNTTGAGFTILGAVLSLGATLFNDGAQAGYSHADEVRKYQATLGKDQD